MRNSLNWGIYWCTNMSIIRYFVSNLKCNVLFKVKYSKIWYRQLLSSDLPFSNEENSDRETAKSWNWNTQYIYLFIYWETGMSMALIFFLQEWQTNVFNLLLYFENILQLFIICAKYLLIHFFTFSKDMLDWMILWHVLIPILKLGPPPAISE